MRKILTVGLLLVLVSCASFGKGKKEQDGRFEGTWQQVNGSSVITFIGSDYEFVDMERGVAGYGNWEYYTYQGEERVRLNHELALLLQFRGDKDLPNSLNGFKEIKSFLIKAWEEYSPLEEKKFITPDVEGGAASVGGWVYRYILDGDNLTIIFTEGSESPFMKPVIGKAMVLANSGEFIRVR